LLVKSIHTVEPWEKVDLEEVCRLDFSQGGRIRLDISAYDVKDRAALVQVAAEHLASADLFLVSVKMIDVSGVLVGAQPEDPGDHGFAFIRKVHRHEQLPDEQAVKTFTAKLLGDFRGRYQFVSKQEIRDHVKSRKQAADPEWHAFINRGPRDSAWGKWWAKC
jgi:hypothetical protein